MESLTSNLELHGAAREDPPSQGSASGANCQASLLNLPDTVVEKMAAGLQLADIDALRVTCRHYAQLWDYAALLWQHRHDHQSLHKSLLWSGRTPALLDMVQIMVGDQLQLLWSSPVLLRWFVQRAAQEGKLQLLQWVWGGAEGKAGALMFSGTAGKLGELLLANQVLPWTSQLYPATTAAPVVMPTSMLPLMLGAGPDVQSPGTKAGQRAWQELLRVAARAAAKHQQQATLLGIKHVLEPILQLWWNAELASVLADVAEAGSIAAARQLLQAEPQLLIRALHASIPVLACHHGHADSRQRFIWSAIKPERARGVLQCIAEADAMGVLDDLEALRHSHTSLLQAACVLGASDAVHVLLRRGADPHAPMQYNVNRGSGAIDSDGDANYQRCFVLAAALLEGHTDVVVALLDAGVETESLSQLRTAVPRTTQALRDVMDEIQQHLHLPSYRHARARLAPHVS